MNATAAALLVVTGMVAQGAEPQTLTLACQGTVTEKVPEAPPEPISMGIIVNFTARTVQGISSGFPVKITGWDDVIVEFWGSEKLSGSLAITVGTIDRVTGDVEAKTTLTADNGKTWGRTICTLKCSPAQRMF